MKIKAYQRAIIFGIILWIPICSFGQMTRQVAITFDDLPATGSIESYEYQKYVTENLLAGIKASSVPAIGFVNEQKVISYGQIDKRTELLKLWLDAGHELGNHTFSHIPINSTRFEDYTADLIRGETITRMLLQKKGMKLRYFRHTQLRTGPTEEYRLKLAKFLKDRGYTVAPVTIDNNEYIFAVVYSRAKAKGDKALAARIVSAYVDYMEKVFEHFENISRGFLGREVRQILLLHANEINADHFDKLAEMMKDRGYRFITLEEALKDEAYKMPEVQSMRGLSWLHRWMLAKGLEIKEEPAQPKWIDELFQQGN
ncbi:MAG: polysaccharide deacetylase family protein [Acidobacteria bacterium]|nr:polysaccharide deacetylase family protein [Acidobacteriota bacterium]